MPGCARERQLAHDAALLDEHDAVAGRLDFAQQVRVEEHRRAARAQLADDVAHEQAAERIEARRRLVEEDERGLVEQRLGEADALQHALAVAAQLAVGGVEQVDAREQLVDARLERRARSPYSRPWKRSSSRPVSQSWKRKCSGRKPTRARAARSPSGAPSTVPPRRPSARRGRAAS